MRSRPLNKKRKKKLILLTPGDPEGIGPEIAWKTLRRRRYLEDPSCQLVCVGARVGFTALGLGKRLTEIDEADLTRLERLPAGRILLLPAPEKCPPARSRKPRLLQGYQAGWSIEKATRLILDGKADALVTGPISKERLQQGGYPYSGHTDFLAALCGRERVTMMLANDQLRISLVTVHLALSQVSQALTREGIRTTVLQSVDHLRRWWGIRKPRLAVAALNPHAGEGGLFGSEELRMITPELESLRRSPQGSRFELVGPLPADTLFANQRLAPRRERYDGVVCMYHDQGLIPVKLLDFRRTVNLTLGLPIIRTSVDHGVAFDIAGRNKADPSSLQAAIDLAAGILNRKTRKSG